MKLRIIISYRKYSSEGMDMGYRTVAGDDMTNCLQHIRRVCE